MPFLERNKIRAEVVFGGASFIAGQTLHGVVKLRVLEPVQIRALRATHVVVEQIRHMKSREINQPSTYECPKIIFDKKAHEQQIFLVGGVHPAGQVHPFVPGEYTFPFSIPLPETLPPSMGLTPLGKKRLGALVQHTVRIDANLCNAMLNYSEFFPVRVVNACPAERYCTAAAASLSQDAPAYNFMKCSQTIATVFPSATYAAEQAEFRLTVPRPIVSIADDGFVSFNVSGLIPCRYEVRLHRTCSIQIGKRAKHITSVVAKTVMPAMPVHSVAEGTIALDSRKVRGVVNMTGQRISSVQHHLSIHLLYDHGVLVDVDDTQRAKVPVTLVPALYGDRLPHHTVPQVPAVGLAAAAGPMATYGTLSCGMPDEPVVGHVLTEAPLAKCAA